MNRLVLTAAWILALTALPAAAQGDRLDRRLARDMERGLIDDRDAAVARLLAFTRPDLLPIDLRALAEDDLAQLAEGERAGCGTPRILDLLRRYDDLDEGHLALAEAALGFPLANPAYHSTSGSDLPPPPEATESCNASAPNEQESDHFVVKWGPSYNGAAVDDVLTAMEAARAAFVDELGYQEPHGIDGSWKLPVFIGNSGGGVPTIGWSGGYTTLCTDHPGAYIVLSQDITSWEFTADVGPHELYHAVQFGYGGGMMIEGWYWEASATWSEDLAYPDINGYVWFLTEYTSQPHLALATENGIHEYGMFIFPMGIEEFVDDGIHVMREIWEQPGSGHIPDAMGDILEEGHGTSFDDAFAVFTARASVMEDFEDGSLYNQPSHIAQEDEYPASREDVSDYPPQAYGSNFIELEAPGDADPPDTKLRFEFDGGGDSSWILGALRHRAAEGDNRTVVGSVDGDGKAVMEFIDFGTLYDAVVIGVSWTGSGASPPYSWTADVVEQTEPQGDDDDDDDSADPDPYGGCLATPSPYHFSVESVEASSSCDLVRRGGAPSPLGALAALGLFGLLIYRRR